MRTVVVFLSPQTGAAEFILIAPLIDLEARGLLALAARGERRAPDVRGAGPQPVEPGARGADVEIHLPAGAEAVALICLADGNQHLAPHGVAEVAKTVERRQRAAERAEPPFRILGRAGDLVERAAGVRKDALLVPGPVRRRPGQPRSR